MSGPDNGTRLRGFWQGEKRWFKGYVTKSTTEDGKLIHRIQYDDGESHWHDLSEEIRNRGRKVEASVEVESEPDIDVANPVDKKAAEFVSRSSSQNQAWEIHGRSLFWVSANPSTSVASQFASLSPDLKGVGRC